MKKIVVIIVFTCLLTSVGLAQGFLEKLKGTWVAKGSAFGMPADVEMTWMAALGGRYTQIQYKIVMHGKEGKDQLFEGTAYYKPAGENKYVATWFDSGGEMHPITATSDENALTSFWGTPETKLGKTIYKLLDNNTVEITDFIQKKDGSWQQFGKNTLIMK
jgi:Protein of unknown function (DUF1579)